MSRPDSAIDARNLLALVNRDIVRLRRWLGHDHGDDAFWRTTGTTAPNAQATRVVLAWIATALHVERATARGRIHGRMFETLDAQREWLVGPVAATARTRASKMLAGAPAMR